MEYELLEKDFQQRDTDVQRKYRELEESLRKFDRFLADNAEKLKKYEKKYQDEKSLREEKETQVSLLNSELVQLTAEKESKSKTLERCALITISVVVYIA